MGCCNNNSKSKKKIPSWLFLIIWFITISGIAILSALFK